MRAIISADELAKDVAGAEALLESHHEHKVHLSDIYLSKFSLNSSSHCSTSKKIPKLLYSEIISQLNILLDRYLF